tara:strand:+ start:324 stop:578 length:255 start_codon:yes stop_codon:yes gene_type:complete
MNKRQTPTPIIVTGAMTFSTNPLDSASTNGLIEAARPIDNSGSVMFDPINVPIATPWERFAAINPTTNSGREVPTAVRVVPITE